jgi:hypothetical protein
LALASQPAGKTGERYLGVVAVAAVVVEVVVVVVVVREKEGRG